MNPQQLTKLATEALPIILISSVAGSANYLAWRFFKNKVAVVVLALSALFGAWGLIFYFFIGPTPLRFYGTGRIYTALLIFFCVIGGYFHKKSIGSSKMNLKDFALLLAISCSTFATILFIDNFKKISFNDYLLSLFYISIFASPSITPILICAWQSMKQRPGIDKPLSD